MPSRRVAPVHFLWAWPQRGCHRASASDGGAQHQAFTPCLFLACRGIQEREPGAPEPARVATEQAVQREYERLVADGVAAKQAEIQAVEQVAAARRAAEAAEQRQGASM